ICSRAGRNRDSHRREIVAGLCCRETAADARLSRDRPDSLHSLPAAAPVQRSCPPAIAARAPTAPDSHWNGNRPTQTARGTGENNAWPPCRFEPSLETRREGSFNAAVHAACACLPAKRGGAREGCTQSSGDVEERFDWLAPPSAR